MHVVDPGRKRTLKTGDVPRHLEDGLGEVLVGHDCTHVIIVVGSGRDDDGASNTTAILGQGVRVVPTSFTGGGEPLVGTLAKRWGSTFSDTRDSTLVVCTRLLDTVPMDRGSVVSHQVGNCDLNLITIVNINNWTRSSTIDQEGWSRSAVKVGVVRSDSKLKVLGLAGLVVQLGNIADDLTHHLLRSAALLSLHNSVSGREETVAEGRHEVLEAVLDLELVVDESEDELAILADDVLLLVVELELVSDELVLAYVVDMLELDPAGEELVLPELADMLELEP